jgi:hypothetical protein
MRDEQPNQAGDRKRLPRGPVVNDEKEGRISEPAVLRNTFVRQGGHFSQRRSRVRLPENSVRNPFENFGILCAKIFRPLDERGSAQKDAKITKTRWPGEPRASSKNLARWRPCRLPLPSAVGAISPASFEHEFSTSESGFSGCHPLRLSLRPFRFPSRNY